MNVRVDEVMALTPTEFDASVSAEVAELYGEIRKRMPGIRCGIYKQPGYKAVPVVYFQDERYVRGNLGYSRKNYRADSNTFYIKSQKIHNERGGGSPENTRLRSKSAATLARKAKTALLRITVEDMARANTYSADALRITLTSDEIARRNAYREAMEMLTGSRFNATPPTNVLQCLLKADLPEIAAAASTVVKGDVVDRRRSVMYVAVYEKRGMPVFDTHMYFDRDTPAQEALPQEEMPEPLYTRLATLNVLDPNITVAGVGRRLSQDEYLVVADGLE